MSVIFYGGVFNFFGDRYGVGIISSRKLDDMGVGNKSWDMDKNIMFFNYRVLLLLL